MSPPTALVLPSSSAHIPNARICIRAPTIRAFTPGASLCMMRQPARAALCSISCSKGHAAMACVRRAGPFAPPWFPPPARPRLPRFPHAQSCLPPRLSFPCSEHQEQMKWSIKYLRGYGQNDGLFSFETGRKCPFGSKVYFFEVKVRPASPNEGGGMGRGCDLALPRASLCSFLPAP